MAVSTLELAEARWLPDVVVRMGIRRLLRQRLREEASRLAETGAEQLEKQLRSADMVVHADDANQQHYEVPADFYQCVLGPHLKYSCGYWPDQVQTIESSEATMLALTCERAELSDGMRILELGCGWGSLSLWMAEHFPCSSVTAVSNSTSQREFILQQAELRGLKNLEVITCNVADLEMDHPFDRIVSVEMFEHVRNHAQLLKKIQHWLTPAGKLFVHIFCHRQFAYLFDTEGDSNWMGRHFFTGGMMPSRDWLLQFNDSVRLEEAWTVNGRHYQRTCEAWLRNLDESEDRVRHIFLRRMSRPEANLQIQRWRMFFMACAELFGYDQGEEWFVAHYRFHSA